MDDNPTTDYLGTRLRHLLDQLEGDVTRTYTDLGLPDFRPRYTPIIRIVDTHGPQSIRQLATTIGITHSAISQTANQMRRDGLVELHPGTDARHRIVHLTDHTRTLLPTLHAEWNATTAAARQLDAELPYPLSQLVELALQAITDKPLHHRIRDHLHTP
ncbi:MarR family winged helix-turn-helix transcriptional regulator [Actinosynnema sp. NPDC023587]|uniref:MarR family winged helix-turn-helix transcriptional regulator n=1 Tax=Actinosynnema sp. NPDC023587 TaxID=3154695 RepID=UPI0033E40F9F